MYNDNIVIITIKVRDYKQMRDINLNAVEQRWVNGQKPRRTAARLTDG